MDTPHVGERWGLAPRFNHFDLARSETNAPRGHTQGDVSPTGVFRNHG